MRLITLLLPALIGALASPASAWNVGVGMADVTGSAAEIGMMGYAKAGQNTAGIYTRLYAKAFVFVDDSGNRGVFVSVDMGMMGHMLKRYVIEALKEEFNDLYDWNNVAISGTHTHSGPAGYQQYMLYSMTNLGYVHETFEAFLTGIVEAIRRAHNNVQPARMTYVQGELAESNINRSPTSYLANPEDERAEYEHDTDHTVSQINIYNSDTDEPLGIINWFAVHPTSVNNTNHLISSDNKGRAGERFQKWMNPDDLQGQGSFVAAFASANLGDVSPNTEGAICQDTGEPCEPYTSTCGGFTQMCWALGPGVDMYDSAKIIGDNQFEKAKELFEDTASHIEIPDGLSTAFEWIDMTAQSVRMEDGTVEKTCKPALGWSFAAGTTDGPGALNFTQSLNSSNSHIIDIIIKILKDPSPEQEACHAPKPILLDTGEATEPHAWHPSIVDTQMLKIGNIFLVAFPGELTTMSGRRMRKTVTQAAVDSGMNEDDVHVVLAGLSSVYTHYVATFEEYQRQRYEAASTIFGPHSLAAYRQQYKKLTTALIDENNSVAWGTAPENLYGQLLSLVPDVLPDVPPDGKDFGDCLAQPAASYVQGDPVVTRFVSGNLRNHPMLEESFLLVQRQDGQDWITVARDADTETMMSWTRTDNTNDWSVSEVEITWSIPYSQEPGDYRIQHMGYFKAYGGPQSGQILYYEGSSNTFKVNAAPQTSTQGTQDSTTSKSAAQFPAMLFILLSSIIVHFIN